MKSKNTKVSNAAMAAVGCMEGANEYLRNLQRVISADTGTFAEFCPLDGLYLVRVNFLSCLAMTSSRS